MLLFSSSSFAKSTSFARFFNFVCVFFALIFCVCVESCVYLNVVVNFIVIFFCVGCVNMNMIVCIVFCDVLYATCAYASYSVGFVRFVSVDVCSVVFGMFVIICVIGYYVNCCMYVCNCVCVCCVVVLLCFNVVSSVVAFVISRRIAR